MRLSPDAVLPPEVERPGYDRAAQAVGMVHLGLGAFHRGHQAVYTEAAMASGDRDWAIRGVSLRSPEMARRLNPQAGLYTVTERGGSQATTRLIGSIAGVIVAPDNPDAVIAALAAPTVHIVTLTITEAGYQPDKSGAPPPFVNLLARALTRRRAAGLGGLTLISCDNLADNGAQLRSLIDKYLVRTDPALLRWFHAECACPSTMVDRIVPAPRESDVAALTARIGVHDAGAVFTEPFHQWVIEDRFAGPRPRWEAAGAVFTPDVRPFETAKLRLLNGAHSAMAYLGLGRGHVTVDQAFADPEIRTLVDRLMRVEAAASLTPAPGQDLGVYIDALQARFANPALEHRLAQIAMDGSLKTPPRWLTVLGFHQTRGQSCPAILTALAAWLRHLRGDFGPVQDPSADDLAALWRAAGRAGIVAALYGPAGRYKDHWIATPDDAAFLTARL